MAFHAHELLWDLPEKLLTYLDEDNPMKEGITEENYLKKRKGEGRDIYSQCSKLGDILNAPMCVDYTNELLIQIKGVMPEVFEGMKKDYQRQRLYPLYIQAHHSHISLLEPKEMTQEILWNMQYLHQDMEVPYPKYSGLFPTEDSFDSKKISAIEDANIDYVVFPHLEEGKVHYELEGEGDYVYQPFWLQGTRRNILALPRNFPISQEIWRPITKMKRDEVKSQGYMLGDFAVFDSEYLTGEQESYPISLEVGVEMYKDVLRNELEKAPDGGLLLYVQDLELMDYGDIALEIIEKAWRDILDEGGQKYNIHFKSPDTYINEVLKPIGLENLPVVKFNRITWAPEIRLILRADGHYPPLGVNNVGPYDLKKTGIFDNPHVFWENGKYYTGVFDALLNIFDISNNVPVDIGKLGDTEYELKRESQNSQVIIYLRLMKRACNWGWRPTEGRQKRPCLLGYLLSQVLLEKMQDRPIALNLIRDRRTIDSRCFVGLCEVLKVFIDNRVAYLKYGLDEYRKENKDDDNENLNEAYVLFDSVEKWKGLALEKAKALYIQNQKGLPDMSQFLILLQEYSQAVYMATDYIQKVWSKVPDVEYMVDKMYHFLYELYPPLFPSMIKRIDNMQETDIEKYFTKEKVKV